MSSPYVKIHNYANGTELVDRLCPKSQLYTKTRCKEKQCTGSLMSFTIPETGTGKPRPLDEIKKQAKAYLDEYFSYIKKLDSPAHKERLEQILKEVDSTGTYELTLNELTYGAKLAWRNASRCINRIQWNRLVVFDARDVTTASGMFDAMIRHIRYATNGGNLRSAITIFKQRTDGLHDFRIWNQGMLSYAGYKNEDGTVTGDPSNVDFTEMCLKLGWKGKGTKWDVLPLVLSANGEDPEWFEIPENDIVFVPIIHPTLECVKEMGMKWYTLPAVASMALDVGGIEFTAIPFNGWYMGTEIGARDLSDPQRYNVLEELATKMGLDTKNATTLWKDKALVELNVAVLYSFQKAGVSIVDHHSASEGFLKHFENEFKVRGGCSSDWVWVVPPMSGSLVGVFHQEMTMYHLKPSYEYQIQAWKTHKWKKLPDGQERRERKIKTFKELAKVVRFTAGFYNKALSKRIKATILYATETGRSELFAKKISEKFGHAFNSHVYPMSEYDIANLEQEQLVIVVASTFGNGDPPENGEKFAQGLHALEESKSGGAGGLQSFIKENSEKPVSGPSSNETNVHDTNIGRLSNTAFAVFGLGSNAYPNFCAFGKLVDNVFGDMGGKRLLSISCGDELNGQEETFREWSVLAYRAACENFCLEPGAEGKLPSKFIVAPDTVRLFPASKADSQTEALKKLHGREVALYHLKARDLLNTPEASRDTIKVELRAPQQENPLSYNAGDHIGIMPSNRTEYVDGILSKLIHKPRTDDTGVQLQKVEVKVTPMGNQKKWNPYERIPCASLRDLLSKYLDITTPPRQDFLAYLATTAMEESEKAALEKLATNKDEYEYWKNSRWPDMNQLINKIFPSVRPDAAVFCGMLPTLQPRFYSVSSSPLVQYNEIHLTVAAVTFNVGDDKHYGVCSNYLKDTELGSTVPVLVRSAVSFHMPADETHPIIMVGPGTGIAPFRGFWQQRLVRMTQEKKDYGKLTLFFGCQTKDSYLYGDDLEKLKADGVIRDVHLALSRDPSVKKTYVQHLMTKEKSTLVKQLLEQNGHFYICGDIKMADEVNKTLTKMIEDEGKMSEGEAKAFILKLRDQNRYHEDIFGITSRVSEVIDEAHKSALSRLEAKSG